MANDYPVTESGHYIVGKSPIHTQVVLTNAETGEDVYIPVKAFSWDKDTALDENLHSGSPLASSLVDGHHTYKFSFETGSWLTTEANAENAEAWEYLAYTHLVRPQDAGRPRIFTINHRSSTYYDDDDNLVPSGSIITFTGCKINRMSENQGENGIIKRTYEGKARRLIYGSGQEEVDST